MEKAHDREGIGGGGSKRMFPLLLGYLSIHSNMESMKRKPQSMPNIQEEIHK